MFLSNQHLIQTCLVTALSPSHDSGEEVNVGAPRGDDARDAHAHDLGLEHDLHCVAEVKGGLVGGAPTPRARDLVDFLLGEIKVTLELPRHGLLHHQHQRWRHPRCVHGLHAAS